MVKQQVFFGQPVTPGIALGPAVILGREMRPVPRRKINESDIDREIARFENAIRLTRRDIEAQCVKAKRSLGDIVARIFDAHLLILEDEITIDHVRKIIREESLTADHALWKVFDEVAQRFAAQKEEIFRDRAQDVRDVLRRMLGYLSGRSVDGALKVTERSILLADELGPSDVLQIDPDMIMGVATDAGGATSHTAILTRVLGVPSIVGLRDITRLASEGDLVAINGNSGKLVLRPTPKSVAKYREKEAIHRKFVESLKDINHLVAETRDGHRIELAVNIELPDEAAKVKSRGAEGVGLFRTEYLFLARGGAPSEEEQTEEYRRVAETLAPDKVVIRTFDIGGDKAFTGAGISNEANPFMGYRAIRIGLNRPEMLKTQLRAILRASVSGNVRLMFPMISGLEELKQAKELLDEARRELDEEGTPYDSKMEVGIMVEVPSAAILADRFAPHVDFFSIGTNDLVQFTLAVDRGNEQVAYLHNPYHPAVLQLIHRTVEAGHAAGIWVGLCGEFAGDSLATLLLVGLGLDELSTSPAAVPEVKKLIRSSTYSDCKALAERALKASTATEIRNFLHRGMKKRFKDMPIWFGRVRS